MTPIPLNSDPWLTPAEVTAEYKISKATLSEWRAKRIGPPFRQLGRAIHYRKSAVDAFIASKMVQTAS
jgi:predicted DNA-binding transcriptional regulator AlpA